MKMDNMDGMDMDPKAAPEEDQADFHGMLLFGDGTAYLSHLPMFMSPHNYQAIFEVKLTKPGSDPFAEYAKDRAKTHTRMYSFTPSEPNFVLTELISTTAAQPSRNTILGTIVRGHFE